jgi:hypothetical protein
LIKVKISIELCEDDTKSIVKETIHSDSWYDIMPTFVRALNGAGFTITKKETLQEWLNTQQLL